MDLWWLALGALLLMVGAILAAVQEIEDLEKRNECKAEDDQESMGQWASWKHRVTIFGTGLVAIGAIGSIILKPELSLVWGVGVFLTSLAFAFIAVVVALSIRRGFKEFFRRKVWATAFAVAVWGLPQINEP